MPPPEEMPSSWVIPGKLHVHTEQQKSEEELKMMDEKRQFRIQLLNEEERLEKEKQELETKELEEFKEKEMLRATKEQ